MPPDPGEPPEQEFSRDMIDYLTAVDDVVEQGRLLVAETQQYLDEPPRLDEDDR